MTKLTEDIIRQRIRNCSSPLEEITTINIIGRDLEDISLLRTMTAVEILSLSVNKICTLFDLQFCKNLKELYLRKNNISDLNELYYLKELQHLAVLGLSQNPCSDDIEYRWTVIKNLPKLVKLDDVAIGAEERIEAFKKGRKIRHPNEYSLNSLNTGEHYPNMYSSQNLPAIKSHTENLGRNLSLYSKNQEAEETESIPSKQSFRGQSPVSRVTEQPSLCSRRESCSPESKYSICPERQKMSASINHRNIIAGILVLVKDLDYSSLELLSLNIKNRLNELSSNGY